MCYCNVYNRIKRKAKHNYYHDKLNVHENDTRKFWQIYINSELARNAQVRMIV